MKNVFNTVKITLAAIVAILVSYYLNLSFYIASGIVTILTIQSTKRDTFKTAIERFVAFVIAIVIAYICFSLFGYTILGFSFYLVFYILICQFFKWYSSMAMNSVLISHFLSFQVMDVSTIGNEFGLFIIGVGLGIIANLHLKKNVYIQELKNEADNQIKYILLRMAKRLVTEVDRYDGTCFDTLHSLIAKAKSMSIENEKNSIFRLDTFDSEYIRMRARQTQILYEMYKNIRELQTQPFTAQTISDFLVKVASEYHVKNDCETLLEEFKSINEVMKSVPLPSNRDEFEDRARLFAILRLLEEFLFVKKDFYHKYKEQL